jgi:two-component sensor histidine kinase
MARHILSVLAPQNARSFSGEADHRVANSLAAIARLVRVGAAKAKDSADPGGFLMEIADRIDAVGKLHCLIARSNTGAVQLSTYLQEICKQLSSALSAQAASFSFSYEQEHLVPFALALPLGLITAELLSNSLKYAHPAGLPAKITLSCSRADAGGLRFVYEDDGVGFPEGFDVETDGNLGMDFIRSLSKELKGAPNWLSDPLGIRFEIVVPMVGGV